MVLPEPDGQVQLRTEKVYVPVKDFPDVSWLIGLDGVKHSDLFYF